MVTDSDKLLVMLLPLRVFTGKDHLISTLQLFFLLSPDTIDLFNDGSFIPIIAITITMLYFDILFSVSTPFQIVQK